MKEALAALAYTLVVLAVVGGIAAMGYVQGRGYTIDEFQAECIARGVAEYDTQTGKWKWTVERKGDK